MREDLLKKAGLTGGESKVYLALLEAGLSSAGKAAQKAGVSRSIIYQILSRLTEKGLVSHIIKRKIKYYQASAPNQLLDYIGKKQQEMVLCHKELEKQMPSFAALQNLGERSKVTIYEGMKGMITAHEHTYQKLKRGETYVYFGIHYGQPEAHHAYWQRDHLRRIKAGIKSKMLFHPKTLRKVLVNRNSFKGNEARYMPIELNSPTWYMCYKDTAAICVISSKPITIEIVSQEVADSFMAYFEEFWKKSKPFK